MVFQGTRKEMNDKGKIMWKAVLADKEREEAAERQEQRKKINFEKRFTCETS